MKLLPVYTDVCTVIMVTLSWELETTAAPVCVQMALAAADSLLEHVIKAMNHTRCIVYATRAIKVIIKKEMGKKSLLILVLVLMQSFMFGYQMLIEMPAFYK